MQRVRKWKQRQNMSSSEYGLRKEVIKSERGRTLASIHKGTAALKKQLFTVGVVRHWNKFPRGVVNATSLGVYKARLDGTLSNLSSGMCPCPWQQSWELDGH